MGKGQAVLLILSEKTSLKFRHFAHSLQTFSVFSENLDLVSHGRHMTQRWSNEVGLSSSLVPPSGEGSNKIPKVIHVWPGTI